MRSIETRLHVHQEHIDAICWTVEWRKNSRSKWKTYCKRYTVAEAEKMREVCHENRGRYPVLFYGSFRNIRFRAVEDLGYFIDGHVKVEYRRWLGRWHSFGDYADLDTAKEVVQKVRSGSRHLPKHGLGKFFSRICKTVESTILCIRFPFLYPRNRFTGKHYSDYDLDTRIDGLFEESHECTNQVSFHKGMTEEELNQMKNPEYRVTRFWKALWCKILKIYRSILEVVHGLPTYTELDAMDTGWRKAFGLEMCKEIKKVLKKEGYLRKYRIMQIKEKWGELCWYDAGAPREVFDIVSKYENVSYNTCIECGRPAKYRSTGWVEPYCEDCLPSNVRTLGNYRLKTEDSGWIEVGIPEQ